MIFKNVWVPMGISIDFRTPHNKEFFNLVFALNVRYESCYIIIAQLSNIKNGCGV